MSKYRLVIYSDGGKAIERKVKRSFPFNLLLPSHYWKQIMFTYGGMAEKLFYGEYV